jgi:hypothetical protein
MHLSGVTLDQVEQQEGVILFSWYAKLAGGFIPNRQGKNYRVGVGVDMGFHRKAKAGVAVESVDYLPDPDIGGGRRRVTSTDYCEGRGLSFLRVCYCYFCYSWADSSLKCNSVMTRV